MEKLKLKYVKIFFKDGNIAVFANDCCIDHYELNATYSEINIIVTVVYKRSKHEVRHEDTFVYNSKDIEEIMQRWL